MSVINVLYTHTHTHHIRLRERSSVRHIISYGVSTPADVTIDNQPMIINVYGLPKIHKPEIPLRPIISDKDSARHKVFKCLETISNSLIK